MSAAGDAGPARRAIQVDGRTARAERTRRAIVDALLALIAEGDLQGESGAHRRAGRGLAADTVDAASRTSRACTPRPTLRLIELQRGAASAGPTDAAAGRADRARSASSAAGCWRSSPRPPGPPRCGCRTRPSCGATRPSTTRGCRTRSTPSSRPSWTARSGRDARLARRALLVNTGWPAWSVLRDELASTQADAIAIMRRTVAALVAPLASPGAELALGADRLRSRRGTRSRRRRPACRRPRVRS